MRLFQKLNHHTRAQAGDTLVEVVFAASILTVLLVSAYNIANLSFRIGAQARERTEAVRLLQDQAERLRLYRDRLAFDLKNSPSTIIDTVHFPCSGACSMDPTAAVTSSSAPQPCTPPNGCYSSGRYRVWITTSAAAGLDPQEIKPTIHAQWESAVNGDTNSSQLDMVLIDKRNIRPRECAVAGQGSCS